MTANPRTLSHFVAAILFAGLALLPVTLRADDLITDVSKRDIPIEWNFTGTNILLFGTVDAGKDPSDSPDVVIIVSGPSIKFTARRKKRMFGIWVNSDPTKFDLVPGYLSISSSRPLSEIATPLNMRIAGIGFDALARRISERNNRLVDGQTDEYSKAVVRLMKRDGLYRENPKGVTIIGKKLFRATIDLPANVPVGKFTAQVHVFRKGQLQGSTFSPLTIQKQGLERIIYVLAFDYPLYYGLLAVALALMAGLTATALFRRD